ncbi:hypothetical protein BCR37DRAFT_77125 [Protomyces lactucae-debilis]|uniref:Uncharacterized protein n=1 Tax=Protomyces lactucae-debilis TaxID=2754530 RepID=A0A1Y2F8B3_PROLT|nr:uncharacterized protein BCR37DRAFT_77125 [Protomyces lactucae-debilis]ORY79877.1 hypothetical protein BCR37DRAFT_77125 [Protomyces lactucae-debilis]
MTHWSLIILCFSGLVTSLVVQDPVVAADKRLVKRSRAGHVPGGSMGDGGYGDGGSEGSEDPLSSCRKFTVFHTRPGKNPRVTDFACGKKCKEMIESIPYSKGTCDALIKDISGKHESNLGQRVCTCSFTFTFTMTDDDCLRKRPHDPIDAIEFGMLSVFGHDETMSAEAGHCTR